MLYNIEGCIQYSDIKGVVAWLERARREASDSDYDKIVKKVANLVKGTKIEPSVLAKIRGDLSRIQEIKDVEEAEKRNAAEIAKRASEKDLKEVKKREEAERKKALAEEQEHIARIKRQFISRYNPPCFYHFTDIRNLPSIRTHGLLTLHDIKESQIQVPAPGANDWSQKVDIRRGLDRFVHLCFFDEHPMEYVARVKEQRIRSTMFIPVSLDVLDWDDIRFTAGVANKSGSRLLTLEKASEMMDFEVIYDRTDWKDPEIIKRRNAAKKYELLIPRSIPIEYLSI